MRARNESKFDTIIAAKGAYHVLFTGGMIFPWMLDENHALKHLKDATELHKLRFPLLFLSKSLGSIFHLEHNSSVVMDSFWSWLEFEELNHNFFMINHSDFSANAWKNDKDSITTKDYEEIYVFIGEFKDLIPVYQVQATTEQDVMKNKVFDVIFLYDEQKRFDDPYCLEVVVTYPDFSENDLKHFIKLETLESNVELHLFEGQCREWNLKLIIHTGDNHLPEPWDESVTKFKGSTMFFGGRFMYGKLLTINIISGLVHKARSAIIAGAKGATFRRFNDGCKGMEMQGGAAGLFKNRSLQSLYLDEKLVWWSWCGAFALPFEQILFPANSGKYNTHSLHAKLEDAELTKRKILIL